MTAPRLQKNGRFTAPIAIDGVKYTVASSITKAINRSLLEESHVLALRIDGFFVEDNGDVIPLEGYEVHREILHSNCFPTDDAKPEVTQMSTAELLRAIEGLGTVQQRNAPTSAKWQKASELLAPMFAEMARREQS